MSMTDFEIIKELGKGTFGQVYMVNRKSDGNTYAMKRVKITKMNIKDKDNALNEIRILASVSHPNIIDYKEAFYDEETMTLNIVMEFANEGDIANKIKIYRNMKKLIPEEEVWSTLVQILLGLKALHDKMIMHRDLKSANIFLNKNGEIKIGDLNVSKVVKSGFLQTQTGTPYYASPEVWSEKPYDFKSDLWSVGCIIYEMCALKPPFRAQSIEKLFKTVVKGEYDPIPITYSTELQNVIAMLLVTDPKKRPSCDNILSHPVISKHMENINLNMTVYGEGDLLNTIRCPMEPLDINEKLPKFKRYKLNIDIDTSSDSTNKIVNSITPTSPNSIEQFNKINKEEKIKSCREKKVFKSPLLLRNKIDLADKENNLNLLNLNCSSNKNAKIILDILRPKSLLPKQNIHSITPNNKREIKKIKIQLVKQKNIGEKGKQLISRLNNVSDQYSHKNDASKIGGLNSLNVQNYIQNQNNKLIYNNNDKNKLRVPDKYSNYNIKVLQNINNLFTKKVNNNSQYSKILIN